MTIHDRVNAVLMGGKPDHLPFISRLEVWYRSHKGRGTLPEDLGGMSLTEVHRAEDSASRDSSLLMP
jgi:hypothetical protein